MQGKEHLRDWNNLSLLFKMASSEYSTFLVLFFLEGAAYPTAGLSEQWNDALRVKEEILDFPAPLPPNPRLQQLKIYHFPQTSRTIVYALSLYMNLQWTSFQTHSHQ